MTRLFLGLAVLCGGLGLTLTQLQGADPADRTEAAEKDPVLHRASKVIGLQVRTPTDNEKIGDIEELVIAPNAGKIRYAVISVGGFLGVGDKFIAVPFKALTFHQEDGGYYLSMNATKQELENAQGFDKD